MISILCCTMRQRLMNNVFNNYDHQQWKEKELILILNKDDMNLSEWVERAKRSQHVSVYQLPEKLTLGECLNYGIKKAKYDYIAKFDDDDYYAPGYLINSMKFMKRKEADLIGKKSIYMYFENKELLAVYSPGYERERVRRGLKGATLIFKKKIFNKIKFPKINRGEDTLFVKKCRKENFRIYSTDKNDYVCIRKSSPRHHTWNVTNKRLLKHSVTVCKTKDYKPIILNNR
ncbi:glycosyltransferase [Paenibacillus spongiae]|uniref:Glycosyltransferase family 2 protein n=1 Tax=Paenibacillus spongiae TaxID=2909671 RepID=A0ABY5S4F3_9BACL|nr:glycosyltransferase family A protein [Paenibacillus spongiae]UVI28373.1 glycosyltransferase family 2 protein [Paenibacillus spongiae]